MLRVKFEVLWKAWYYHTSIGVWRQITRMGWMWVPNQLTIWAWFDFMNQLLDGINLLKKFLLLIEYDGFENAFEAFSFWFSFWFFQKEIWGLFEIQN
jgi:hypothetical protein